MEMEKQMKFQWQVLLEGGQLIRLYGLQMHLFSVTNRLAIRIRLQVRDL